MEKKLLHTPVGVRDIYGKECELKIELENKINKVFNTYGYHNIFTPTFEFFDVYSEERGSVSSKDMYKFFDRDGNTLVLRPDITPAIARMVSKYYQDEVFPVKLCYNMNTFINHSELQGKLKESTQLGCEMINDDSIEADAEIIALVVNSLRSTGLDEFLVEVGQVDFYKGIIEKYNLSSEMERELRNRISNKNIFGVEELLEDNKISEDDKKALMELPSLFGSQDVLETAKSLTDNETAINAITRLEKLFKILDEYNVSKYVSIDLGMLSNFNYYTGIIFKAYTYGSGEEIVTGGRYDKLLSQFGESKPAIGFGIYADQILNALYRESLTTDIEIDFTTIVYDKEARVEAIKQAEVLRSQGVNTELILNNNIDLDKFVQSRKDMKISNIIYVSKDGKKEL